MARSLPAHIEGLIAYLSRPEEKANEDQALAYFRKVFGEAFTRQKEAKRADGYVAGHFVLELKGKTADWLSGLFQGLAYRKTELAFGQVVVAAKNFLAIWQVEDLPESLRDEVLAISGAPSSVGKFLAGEYAGQREKLLKLAVWNSGVELSGSLFASQPELVISKIQSFEKTLKEGRKVRRQITPKNFTGVLKEMTQFFDPTQPIKAVRAFYSMAYGWTGMSTLQLSHRASDQATLGGELITNLRPSARERFKEFVENHAISLGPNEDHDDFFAAFDKALDAVDKDFRVKHGIFFTDLELSRFVMWLVKQHIPNLGKNYLVIDPACGSGNLVTNWKSPLELRHKVVSEIEPELLFAIERRMQGDQWHKGKFTVIPKVNENKGLNFLKLDAKSYLEEIRGYLAEKGHNPDKPLAFLCNPPYKNDDDRIAYEKTNHGRSNDGIGYKIHDSIIDVTGVDASSERYCCFLAQMKLICDAARTNGLPDESLLLLFTKSSWLTKRSMFSRIRSQMLEAFEDVAGIIVKGDEFFDVKGSWPVAFSVWRYKAESKRLNGTRSIPFLDLTWLTKKQLSAISWENAYETEKDCAAILARAAEVRIGVERNSIRDWSGGTRKDFIRNRRKEEQSQKVVGGLPLWDERHNLKKAHGEMSGTYIGFMDDLTPCRVKTSSPDKPWFRLDSPFMDMRKSRCLSGPPSQKGYCATDREKAKKYFFWYALTKTFLQHPYPMWVDSDDLWEPRIPEKHERTVFQAAFAIGYAENDCIEARFPANNPGKGTPELTLKNPMTPLDRDSFWSTELVPFLDTGTTRNVSKLVASVDDLYSVWRRLFARQPELPLPAKPYSLEDGSLTSGAGIVQIRDYAREADDQTLLRGISEIQGVLRSVKSDFFSLLTSRTGLNYFGEKIAAEPKQFRSPVEVPGPKSITVTRHNKRRTG